MALITMPSKVLFSKVDKLQLLRAGTTLRSKYTGKRQAAVFPFAVWVFDGTLIPMVDADAGEWRAFLAQLEGAKNTFELPVPGFTRPTASADVYTGAAAARARSVAVFTPFGAASAGLVVASKGDYFTVNGELKLATAPCVLDGAGNGTLAFEPGLRAATVNGVTNLELQEPYCTMSAMDDDAATWALERPVKHGIRLRAIEAF